VSRLDRIADRKNKGRKDREQERLYSKQKRQDSSRRAWTARRRDLTAAEQ
jgi:hypothetical protein